jgi:hypothetical protein
MTEDNQHIIVACCGLICSDCARFKKNKCGGCRSKRPVFLNCKIRKCNIENHYYTCAECKYFEELKECKKLNNMISKIFEFIYKTKRIENLNRIREIGLEKFKSERMLNLTKESPE